MSGDAPFDVDQQAQPSAVGSQLRRARVDDAAAIATVHVRTWQSAYRGQLPDPYLDSLSDDLEQRTEMWETAISGRLTTKHEVWVAATDKQIDGFVALGPTRDEDTDVVGEVYAIYVNPDSWGQGIGRILFSHATVRLVSLGYAAAILWVLESNARARRFYEVAGWTADGATKLETRPDGTQLREVRYRISLASTNEGL